MSKTISETKDNFAIYQQSIDKYFTNVEQTVSRYFQAFTDLQEEYIHAWRNIIRANLSVQKEFVKTCSVRDQIAISTIEVAKKNIKTFSDNASSFADLNRDIMQSWMSLCTPAK